MNNYYNRPKDGVAQVDDPLEILGIPIGYLTYILGSFLVGMMTIGIFTGLLVMMMSFGWCFYASDRSKKNQAIGLQPEFLVWVQRLYRYVPLSILASSASISVAKQRYRL